MHNIKTLKEDLTKELELHQGKVYIPINRQLLMAAISALDEVKETPEPKKTNTRRSTKKN